MAFIAMRRVLVPLCCACLTGSPVAAQEPSEGFPVVVTVLDGAAVDSAFLARTAFAVAHRWATPSKERAAFGDWRRVRERTIPAIPRWSDDWSPNGSQRTSATLVLRRRGRPTLGPLSPPTGDQLFDASIPSIVRDPMPASPAFPDLPATVATDSVALQVTLGIEPEGATPGLVRFARFQERAVAIPGTLRVDLARRRTDGPELRADARIGTAEGLNIIFKFDIEVDGSVDPRSLQLLATNDRDLARLVQEALLMARYSPARTNGHAVRITVIQQFGG